MNAEHTEGCRKAWFEMRDAAKAGMPRRAQEAFSKSLEEILRCPAHSKKEILETERNMQNLGKTRKRPGKK